MRLGSVILLLLLLCACSDHAAHPAAHETPAPAPKPEFSVAMRTPHIGKFPCSTCHQSEPTGATMHVDIVLKHAETMNCNTCHQDSRDSLRLLDGSQVGFDRADKLCSQCHFQQGKDWAGGAHGKRVSGWNQAREILSCTACHDPHQPGFDQRFPHTFPRIPRTTP